MGFLSCASSIRMVKYKTQKNTKVYVYYYYTVNTRYDGCIKIGKELFISMGRYLHGLQNIHRQNYRSVTHKTLSADKIQKL